MIQNHSLPRGFFISPPLKAAHGTNPKSCRLLCYREKLPLIFELYQQHNIDKIHYEKVLSIFIGCIRIIRCFM